MSVKPNNSSGDFIEENTDAGKKQGIFGSKPKRSDDEIIESMQNVLEELASYIKFIDKTTTKPSELELHSGKLMALKKELDNTFWEWYKTLAYKISDPDSPSCPQCGFILSPTTSIATDGITPDGQNYICRHCHANNPSNIRLWHMIFSDGEIKAGNVNSAY